MSTLTAERSAHVLQIAPDLGSDLDPAAFEEARRLLRVPVVDLPAGDWDPVEVCHSPQVRGRAFGCLIASGLIVREVLLAGRPATSLYGPRDLIGIDDLAESSLPVRSRYAVASPATVIVLDDRFLAGARHWPRVVGRLTDAMAAQVGRGCAHQAVSQLPRVEHRLVALFWHLADRWGHVGPNGITIDLPLTHEALGRLVGARRPTVSLGLQALAEEELLTRRAGGDGWLLAPRSIELLAVDEHAAERLGRSILVTREGPRRPAAARIQSPERQEIVERLRQQRQKMAANKARFETTIARSRELRLEVARRRSGEPRVGGTP
jgi:CRP-like cAMP-binding protein